MKITKRMEKMINLNNKVSIQQVMKMINNETGVVTYLVMDEDKWVEISQDQYNEIRGNKNEQ